MTRTNATRNAEAGKTARNGHRPRNESRVAAYLTTSLVWQGVLALGVGAVSVIWPDITVGAFVILFAVYAFVTAIADAVRGLASDRVGPVVGYLVLSLLSMTAGVVALV